MKPNRLTSNVLIVACVLLMLAGCEEQAMQPKALSPNWFNQPAWKAITPVAAEMETAPRIEFQRLIHDFGDVGLGTNHLADFHFRNAGDGVLKIEQVTKTCGCTPFLLEKTEYAPGESGTLKVQYYAEAQYGSTAKQLVVQSNDRQNPAVTLAIQARIVTKVSCEPRVLNLSLNRQNAACPNITLTSRDNKPFAIQSFRSTANCITADYNPSEKATRFVLQPKVDMEKLENTLNGRIEIGLTHPECKTVAISLRALPRFRISPGAIVFHGADPEKPVVKKVRIYNNYEDDFELESAMSPKGYVQVLNPKKLSNGGYELQLEITPPPPGDGTRGFTETVLVTVKGGKELKIPCNGFYTRKVSPRITLIGGTTSTTSTTSVTGTRNPPKPKSTDALKDCEDGDCRKVFHFKPGKTGGL